MMTCPLTIDYNIVFNSCALSKVKHTSNWVINYFISLSIFDDSDCLYGKGSGINEEIKK